ncbi:MAG TPA: hypothetical protein VJ227_01695 [Patescibacteria group bacterium]|nr:hypothetical protein [Patescibacteria group bacterium]
MTTHKHSALVINKINKIKQRVTLFVNPSILKQARAQAVVDELSLTALVEKALVNFLPKETVIKKLQIRENYGH